MPPGNDKRDDDVRFARWDDERRPGALPGQAHAPEGRSAGACPDAGIPSCVTVPAQDSTHLRASDWTRTLAKYRQPRPSRSVFELAVTLVPFVAIWAVAWWMLSISAVLALVLALANAAFLVRLFMIQHDCGHGSFFRDRRLCDWIGRGLGVLTLTPYDVWRRTHAIHHASTGNLDRRGVGDIPTLTVTEYRQKGWLGRALYRLIRNPVFLFGVVPFYTFFLQNRLPVHLMRSGWRYWLSAMATNAAIVLFLSVIVWLGGWDVLLFVFLPTMLLAAIAGMWFFYVQHQFEETSWQHEDAWNVQEAALHGSSHYDLPRILRWITGNIGVHHVHHLACRIPFYRLSEVITDHAILAETRRITLWQSFRCARLHLWDEKHRKLLSFAEARALTLVSPDRT
ncbi:fatty acid desaturase [Tropicimonas sp. IMCC6043]|uniref:fatty acid desaturase n=1 Tax=Tropicimonas sp. IMCC6043 TaxID=2510645 RepID=UPI001F5CE4C5|nr:fatty acid desaturase [Tropicimonas sp. IMCC6043]